MKKLLFALSYLLFQSTEGSGGNPNKLTLDDLDPSKLKNLTDEQLATLKDLTDAEIKALAEKYPNKPTENNYLVLEDTRKNAKQLNNTSSWKNLGDLRGPLGQKHWRVKTIKSKFIAEKPQPEAKTQDLTQQEVKGAEGVNKVAPSQKLSSIPGGQAKDNGAVKQEVTGAEKTDLNQDVKTDIGGEKIPVDNPIVDDKADVNQEDKANQTEEFSETDVKDDEAALQEMAQKNAATSNKPAGTNKPAAGNKGK